MLQPLLSPALHRRAIRSVPFSVSIATNVKHTHGDEGFVSSPVIDLTLCLNSTVGIVGSIM